MALDYNYFHNELKIEKSTNFEFLKECFNDIYKLLFPAEILLQSDDAYPLSVIYCRSAIALITDKLCQKYNIGLKKENNNISQRIKYMADYVDAFKTPLYIMDDIRKMGNKAAHSEGDKFIEKADAYKVMSQTFEVVRWYYFTETDNAQNDILSYKTPNNCGNFCIDEEQIQKTEKIIKQKDEKINQLTKIIEQLDEDSLKKLEKSSQEYEDIISKIEFDEFVKFLNGEIILTDRNTSLDSGGQKQLVEKIITFIRNPQKHIFLMKGHAGTGKTTIIKGLVRYLEEHNWNCKLAAPTGKAANVLQKKTDYKAQTIHGLIYDRKEDKATFKGTVEDKTILIFDEASMLSTFTTFPDIEKDLNDDEFAQRANDGEEYDPQNEAYKDKDILLDTVRYMGFDRENSQNKIIFVGDDGQLPPVCRHPETGEMYVLERSPALDNRRLRTCLEKAGLNIKSIDEYTLTEVVRQNNESGILKYAEDIRSRTGRITPPYNGNDIIRKYSFNETYLDLIKNNQLSCTMCIVSDNQQAALRNKIIRKIKYQTDTDEIPLNEGDTLITMASYWRPKPKKVNIKNGELLYVSKIENRQIDVNIDNKIETVKYMMLSLKKRKNGDDINDIYVLNEYLNGDKRPLTKRQQDIEDTIIQKLADNYVMSMNILPGSYEYDEHIKDFKKQNVFMQVKYGYAITCHKAQGSEWDNIVLCKDELTNTVYSNKWLYTAITRAKKKLYIIDDY